MSELALIITIVTILLSLFVVLVERKLLAYSHRRMGPAFVGRNGIFQIVLDLIKLLTKETFLIPQPTTVLAPVLLAFVYGLQLIFSQQFVFTPLFFLFDNLDALILHYLILVLLSSIIVIILGFLSQSRYAMIGTFRSLIHLISLDIFITVVYSLLILSSFSTNFHDFFLSQSSYWYFFLYAPLASIFIIILLVEAKRTPFDHTETESEVVAGYLIEYNSAMLLIFYLVEYVHVLISSIHFILCFCSGWVILGLFFFLPSIFILPNDCFLWFFLF